MFNQIITLFLIYLLSTLSVQAQETTFAGFKMAHPFDFGEVLVGAARLELQSIQATQDIASLQITAGTGAAFKFTGAGYQTGTPLETTSYWRFYNDSYVAANYQPSEKMGILFAPTAAGTMESKYSNAHGESSNTIKGTGIFFQNSVGLEIGIGNAQQLCDNDGICSISLPQKGSVIFTVIPKISIPPNLNLNHEWHKHVRFHLKTVEYNTSCNAFAEQLPNRKLANINDYLDYVEKDTIRSPREKCNSNYDYSRHFTASIDKSIDFKSINQSDTGINGYVEYIFYTEGSYDVTTEKCVDNTGCKIYRVSANGTAPPVTTNQPPIASFVITKSGTVVDSVKVGESVTLDASQSSDLEKGSLTYQWWSSDPAITIPPAQKPSVSFPTKGNYKIKIFLTVADDKGAASTTVSQDISISDNIAPSETFTLTTNVNPAQSGSISGIPTGKISKDTPITLTATPTLGAGFEFDFWGKDCNGTGANNETLSKSTEQTIIITKGTTCTANFKQAQTQPTGDLKACFEIQSDSNNPKQKTLDASCTVPNTANVTYNWIIYHLNSEPFSTSMPVGKITNPILEGGKHTVVLIASIGEELSVFSESIIVASTPTTVFDNQLKINAETNATKVSLKNVGSIPSKVAETISTHPIKYLWFSKSRNGKLGEGLELQNIDLQYTGKDVVTLIAYNDADYIKSVSQVITLLQESNPDPGINNISPKKQQFDAASSLDNQSVVFMLDGSISEDPDNTPDPTKGIKQYKWKWEVSSNSGDLPADKSSSESPPFSIKDVFLGESQQFKFTLKVVDDEDQESDSGVSRIIAIKKPSAKFTAPRLVEVGKEFILNATEPTPSEYKLDGTILSTDSNLNYRWIITDNQGTDVSSSVLQDNSVPTRPKMKITSEGVYTLTLAVVDNYGLYQKTQPVKLIVENSAELVSLDKGTLTKITSTGTPTGVDDGVVSFESGISIKDNQQYGNFLLNQKVAVGTEFKLRARISSNSLDKQVVDLLLVVGIEPVAPFDGGIDTVYHSYDDTGNLVLGSDKKPLVHNLYGKDPKIDWIPQLTTVPFANKVILTSAGLNLGLDGMFVSSGKYYFFIGYVQSDGTIVYSKSPIEVMVE